MLNAIPYIHHKNTRYTMTRAVLSIFLLLQLLRSSSCDRRVQESISAANTSALLQSIEQIELKRFSYKYPQFYNPVFGKEQIGFIAQDLAQVDLLPPSTIGRVKKRTVDKDIQIEDLHVVNQDAIYMANVGATQELIKRVSDNSLYLEKLLGDVESTRASSTGLFEGLQGNVADITSKLLEARMEVSQVSDQLLDKQKQAILDAERKLLSELELTQTRLQTALETSVLQMQKELEEASRSAHKAMAKVEMEEEQLAFVKNTTSLLRNTVNLVEEELRRVKERVEANDGEILATRTALKSLHAEVEVVKQTLSANVVKMTELEASWKTTEARVSDVSGTTEHAAQDILQLKERTREVETRSATLEAQAESIRSSVAILQENTSFSIDKASRTLEMVEKQLVADQAATRLLKDTVTGMGSEHDRFKGSVSVDIANAAKAIEQLSERVNRTAAKETVEKRRIVEAEVELARLKLEEIRVRAEEERKSAQLMVDLDLEKQKRSNNESLTQVRAEEEARRDSELTILAFKQNLTLVQERERAERELEIEAMKSRALFDRAELEKSAKLDQVRVEAEMEALHERENHDIRVNVTKLEAEESRRSRIAAIRTAADEARKSVALAAANPRNLLHSLGWCVLLAFGLFASRESAVYLRRRIEDLSGKPSLIRETSRRNLLFKRVEHLVQFAFRFAQKRRTESTNVGIELALKDVVLSPHLKAQVQRIALSAKAAHDRNAPLRHVMLHGPPGTGKTMAAKRIARWCGLDYAIMSGADVAPLQNNAVTELHKLFRWAVRTKKGVLLFIDEADAFLSSRDSSRQSEAMRNALTTLLYHTGEPSTKLMLVLTTNRPRDIDVAVLDRIDESVEFPTPSVREREVMLEQYYSNLVSPLVNFANKETFSNAAARTSGFSGREIAKLMSSFQTHIHAISGAERVEGISKAQARALFEQVLASTIAQHRLFRAAKLNGSGPNGKSTNQQETP